MVISQKRQRSGVQRTCRQVSGINYTRTYFSVVTAFATIIHETQSAIIDRVAVHLDNMLSCHSLFMLIDRQSYAIISEELESNFKKRSNQKSL